MTQAHYVEVAPERFAGWVERFAAAHGGLVRDELAPSTHGYAGVDARRLEAADGSWARSVSWAPDPPALLVVLVRRGGYAVAVASGGPAGDGGGQLVAHKVGTRRVQSRTAAGGWSQQRYARRRGNQADALVEAVVGHAVRVLGEGEPVTGPVGSLVLGGDRTLAHEVTEAVATGERGRLHGIPRRELWDLPDPRRAVLDDAVRRGRAVRVEVVNAQDSATAPRS